MSSAALLSACGEVEHVYDRAYQGVDGAYDSVFSSNKAPKMSATKVDVTTPLAAPYVDVKANEVNKIVPTSPAVELGAMRDEQPLDDIKMEKPVVAEKPAPQVLKAPPAMPVQAPIAASSADLGSPLLVIRFNQNHVYYDDALNKIVAAAEKAKTGVTYSVVSKLPDIASLSAAQQDQIKTRSTENLKDVVMLMQQQGVPSNRVRIANKQAPVRSQEIAVYVN